MEALLSRTTPDAREARRFRAWELHQKGWKQQQIAEALGVTQGAASQWLKRAGAGGVEALRSRPVLGAPRRLSAEQVARLPELLSRGAEAFGFRGEVWTRGRMKEVIRREFGVAYSQCPVGRLLQEIGWSLQKPLRRARQRNEAKVTAYREERWPALNKRR
jgi:transposase